MSTVRADARPRVTGLRPPSALLSSVVGGLVLGGSTQVGQTYLPAWLHSIANSGAPWVLAAFGFALVGRVAWVSCVCGALTLAGLELGYVAVATMRGFPSASTTVMFWLTAAAFFGPLAGLAAYSLRYRVAPWAALGGGLIAGIVSGEGLASYLTIRDTTTPAYWIAQMLLGLVLLLVVGRRSGPLWTAAGFTVGVCLLLATRYLPILGR